MTLKLQALREARNRITNEANEINSKYDGKEPMSQEDQSRFGDLLDQIERIDKDISMTNKFEELSIDTVCEHENIWENTKFINPPQGAYLLKNAPIEALNKYIRTGDFSYKNTMSTTTGTEGGYLVPDDYATSIEVAMKAFGQMRTLATIARTADGAAMHFPTGDSTAEVGEFLPENTEVKDQDTSFGEVIINSYVVSSKVITVPKQLVRDSKYDLEGYLRSVLAERLGRTTEDAYINGTGVNQPSGIITTVATGVTGASTKIVADELISLQHSVDPAYRNAPGVGFLMHDSTIQAIRKLQDTEKRYIFIPGYERDVPGGVPDRLLGFPVYLSNNMPELGAGKKAILFGDFRKYVIRDVANSMELFRFEDSTYTRKYSVGYAAFMATGGALVDPGGAVKAWVGKS